MMSDFSSIQNLPISTSRNCQRLLIFYKNVVNKLKKAKAQGYDNYHFPPCTGGMRLNCSVTTLCSLPETAISHDDFPMS